MNELCDQVKEVDEEIRNLKEELIKEDRFHSDWKSKISYSEHELNKVSYA